MTHREIRFTRERVKMQIAENYEFLIYPKIVSGTCVLENIPSELDSHNVQKPLVITSKNIVQKGSAKILIKAFYDSTIIIGAVYDAVIDYAGISQAREAAYLFHERGCDSIIVLGSGPTVDLAKAVNLLVSEKRDTLKISRTDVMVGGPLKPLMLIPAGPFNGWETTNIMTIDNQRVQSDFLFPEAVFIDPRIILNSFSIENAAESSAVSLVQAFTALTATCHNPMIDALAYPAMHLIAGHLKDALRPSKNSDAAIALANAAAMAQAAYCNVPPAMAHLIAEELSSASNIPSGKFIPLLLSAEIAQIENQNSLIRDELCLAVAGLEIYSAAAETDRRRICMEMLKDLIDSLKRAMAGSLQELKIQPHLLNAAADAAARKSAEIYSEQACRQLLSKAWEANAA